MEIDGINFEVSEPHVLDEVLIRDVYCVKSWIGKHKPVVLDLGANVGTFALLAAKHGCVVFACEPMPQVYQALQRNLTANPTIASRIQAFPFGVARSAGERTMRWRFEPAVLDLEVAGDSSLYPTDLTRYDRTSTVSMRTISQVMEPAVLEARSPTQPRRPLLIKMDVEGAEREIFDVMTLTEAEVIVMEYHAHDGLLYRDLLDSRFRTKVISSDSGPFDPACERGYVLAVHRNIEHEPLWNDLIQAWQERQ